MFTRSVVLATLALALGAPSASALSLPVARSAVPTSLAVGQGYWGVDPCVGRTSIILLRATTLADLRGEPETTAADADPASCTIRLAYDSDVIDSRTALCTAGVHEAGHLHGLRFANPHDPYHSPNPRSVMADASEVFAVECMMAFVPYEVRSRSDLGWMCAPNRIERWWRCTKPGRTAAYVAVI